MIANEKLLEKWSPVLECKPGTEEGDEILEATDGKIMKLDGQMKRAMAQILETHVTEATLAGDIATYNKAMIPLLRRDVPALIPMQMFGVHAMAGPVTRIPSLRVTYQNDSVNTLKRPATDSVILTVAAIGAIVVGTTISGDTDNGNTGIGVVRHVEGNNILVDVTSGTFVAGNGIDDVAVYVADATTISAVYDNEAMYPLIFTNYTGPVATATGEAYTTDMKEYGTQIDLLTVTAKSRKAKTKWTKEVDDDLQSLYNLSAGQLLQSIGVENITAEINREHINLFDTYATSGGVTAWDYASGPDGRWEKEIYENLNATINRVKYSIASTNKRGQGNVMIVSPGVLAAFETTGKLNDTGVDVAVSPYRGIYLGCKVFVDLYATSDYINIAYKGSNEADAGAYYCPYKPISIERGVGEESGQPRMFFYTRYGTAQNPFGVSNYFRKITVANLPT